MDKPSVANTTLQCVLRSRGEPGKSARHTDQRRCYRCSEELCRLTLVRIAIKTYRVFYQTTLVAKL